MKGFIDRVDLDRCKVSGWVEVADPRTPPRLVATLDGRHIGTASLGPARADVQQSAGLPNASFVMCFPAPLADTALLSGAFELSAVLGGIATRIHLSSGGRHIEKQRIVDRLRTLVPEVRFGDEGMEGRLPSGNLRPVTAGDLSSLPFPVGLTSPDGSAVLGPQGHLFLIGGTNRLSDRYRSPVTNEEKRRAESEVERWVALCTSRQERLTDIGTIYRQIVIPEKSTVMRHLLDDITGPTPVFSLLEERLTPRPWYVSGLRPFAEWAERDDPWQRLDAHCTPAGSLALVRALLTSLPGCEYELGEIDLAQPESYVGDLSKRFFGIDLWDFNLAPRDDVMDAASVELVRAYDPDGGTHTNIHRIWKNPAAPIPKTVVVFGNSFFGAFGNTSSKLSWWFARLFGEFHFTWTPVVDDEYVEQVRPDYVIAQTIERFLGRVPDR